jgi:acid phosphatase
MKSIITITILLCVVLLFTTPTITANNKYEDVEHIITIVMENWSFDGLFGLLPQANGIAKATQVNRIQLDRNNEAYTTLPQVEPAVPQDLPNDGPFNLQKYIDPAAHTIDLTHTFYTEQMQMNKGHMNKYVTYSSAKGLVMSYYDARETYIGELAMNYTLFDNYFHAAYGGSWMNHIYLVCPLTPVFPNCPAEMVNQIDEHGNLLNPDKDEVPCTPDNYAVNTIYSPEPPTPAGHNSSRLLPLQNLTTIGDLLTEKGVSWVWYSGGYDDAMAGKPDESFQYHHQPFIYFSNYAVGKPGRDHLQDEKDLLNALQVGTLPKVTFYKPLGKYNMHPGYSVAAGEAQAHLKMIVEAIQNSKYWEKTVVFITFDEHGGRWDHVPSKQADRWGPGSRIPTIAISPLVKKKFVDSTHHDSTSIMKFIEDRFGLKPIGTRDAAQNGFDNMFVTQNSKHNGWKPALIVLFILAVLIVLGVSVIAGVVAYSYNIRRQYQLV